MTRSTPLFFYIVIDGHVIEYIPPFHPIKILGSLVCGNNRTCTDTEAWISKAWSAFWANKAKLLHSGVDISIRLRILNTFVKPVLLFGSAAWMPTKDDLAKVHSCHLQMSRYIVGDKPCSQRVRKLWCANQILSWDHGALHNIHRWAGHITRYALYDNYRWPCTIASWRDAVFINYKRLRSCDGRHLGRGHRRKPRRWEDQFLGFYDPHSRKHVFSCLASGCPEPKLLGSFSARLG